MISAVFVVSAIDKFLLIPSELELISSLHLPEPAVVARITGIFELLGVASLVLGFHTRTSALILATFMTFVTLAFVKFWSFDGPLELKGMLRNIFFGNIAITGGLIYLSIEGPGRFAVSI
jgi:putative oxidoreductase